MKTKFKVQIVDGQIIQNGVVIGTCGKGREIWIDGVTGVEGERNKFVARFKYARAGTCARSFVKFVFSRITMQEYFAQVESTKKAPGQIAEAMGWEHPNIVAARKAKAEAEEREARYRNTPVIMMKWADDGKTVVPA